MKRSTRQAWASGLSFLAALVGGFFALVSTAFGFAWGELLYAIPPALSLLATVILLARLSPLPPLVAMVGQVAIVLTLLAYGAPAWAAAFLVQTVLQAAACLVVGRRSAPVRGSVSP